jgi:hypothetical protein
MESFTFEDRVVGFMKLSVLTGDFLGFFFWIEPSWNLVVGGAFGQLVLLVLFALRQRKLRRENIEKRVGVLRGVFNPLMRLCVVHMFMSAIHLHNIMHDAHVLFSRHVICACVCVQEH